MARADVPMHGLCLLNRWPKVMREVEYRFNQITGDGVLQLPQCQNHVYVQYERDYIAQALYDAAVQAREYLGYAPAPMWVENEVIALEDSLAWNGQQLATQYGHVQAFGRRATTEITSNVTVSYTDEDDDGCLDTATLTVTGISAIDADEIQVFFRTADGTESAAHENWRIEPLTVTKSGGTATIKGSRALFVQPSLWTTEYRQTIDGNIAGWIKNAGDVQDDDNFVASVDVYRVYADATSAVELLLNPQWVTTPTVNATADITNAEQGYFTLRTGTTQTQPESNPTHVRVSYLAGLPLVNGLMDAQFETAIVRYANTLMAQTPDFCDRTAAMWKDDNSQSPQASAFDAWHPPAFGITKAGMKLLGVVNARYNPLKGKATRPANA